MTKPQPDLGPISEDEVQAIKAAVQPHYIAPTVEACPAIEVKMLRNRKKQWNSSGEMTWLGQRSGRVVLEARYEVIGIPKAERSGNILENIADQPTLLLVIAGVAQWIRLRPCPGGFGGVRHYFACPTCARNYRKLFLAPGKLLFACRCCEKLRYSSQRRDLDFYLKPIAAKLGVKRRIVRKHLEEIRELAYKETARQLEQWNRQAADQADVEEGGM